MDLDKIDNIKQLLETKEWRLTLWRSSLQMFAMIYFPHYFTFSIPEFHKKMYKLLQFCWENPDDTSESFYNNLVLIAFRDAAKTSLAKIEMIRNICFGLRTMMLYVCYDEDASKDNLFDVALELQTNKQIIADFWTLYYEDDSWKSKYAKKKSKKSSISNFLTSNWVRVQASSVKKAVRWKVFAWQRIDFVILDDFETHKSKKSVAITKQVINYFNELIPWTSANAKIIYLCNKISDSWSVQYLIDRFEDNPNGRVFEVALIENWQLTWPDRFSMTDAEADKRNKELQEQWSKNRVRSVETLKRTLNKNWRDVFSQEYLNQPLVDWDRIIDTKVIDRYIDYANTLTFEKDWQWKIWDNPEFGHEYILWIDVSEWLWIDSSVIQVIDTLSWEQVAEYETNTQTPNELVEEIIEASNNYNNARIIPERNSVWQAVIALLKEKWYASRMTSEKVFDTVRFKKVTKYGFHTNAKSKPRIIFNLKEAVENWYLILKSKALLRELRNFWNLDTQYHSFDEDSSNHFDRCMAIAIAWDWVLNFSRWWRVPAWDRQSLPQKTLAISKPKSSRNRNIIDLWF